MAKTQGQVTDEWDNNGRFAGKVESRKVRTGKERLIPWTAGPQNRRQRAARALWG
jgi:hypothetical protein